MNIKQAIGRRIRELREQNKFSQEALAERSAITYQYLSSVENGKENVTIGVLEAIATALHVDLVNLLGLAMSPVRVVDFPKVNRSYLRQQTPLPSPMTFGGLEAALNETQRIICQINTNLIASGARILQSYIQGNNFSGLVSNLLCDSLAGCTAFKHNSNQAYPDLIGKTPKGKSEVGLEVKSTINIGKGGESHNGHSGWHLVSCFQIDDKTGNILFVHVMLAPLNAHNAPSPDWKYLGSRVNPTTGSRRTETYTTNLQGTTRLRDGSAYLDPNYVSFSRWRQPKRDAIPSYSIFATEEA